MNQLLTLSIFQSKKDNLSENNNKLLFPELPFYGIGGTIHHIEEAPEAYYKVLYNQDGTINSLKLPISKKKGKNYALIKKEYYQEVEKCLKVYETQYLEHENNKYKPTLTNNQFYLLAIVTFLAGIASIPFLLTTAWIGLIFTTVSVLALYIVCDLHKKDITNTKNQSEFKKQYKELQRNLIDYKSGTSTKKKVETSYTKIEEIDKSSLKTLPNIKILTKEGIKEAA